MQAINALTPLFEGHPIGASEITFHDLAVQVIADSGEYLRSVGLQA